MLMLWQAARGNWTVKTAGSLLLPLLYLQRLWAKGWCIGQWWALPLVTMASGSGLASEAHPGRWVETDLAAVCLGQTG